MSQTFQNIKGTFDILPDPYTDDGGTRIAPSAEWRYVEATVRDVMARYNFDEIRTPILEPTALVARGVGEATDIVQKEMFAFERSDTQYVLRPEITAPVVRSYLQHHLDQRGGVQKLFYIGPCFRAEQPQKGRYRQFHQFGVEVLGTDDARADAETVAVMMAIYDELGIKDTRLRMNTLGTPDRREEYVHALREYLEPYADELSETSRRRLKRNPLRVLDTKLDHEQAILQDAPQLIDYVSDESRAHYDRVQRFLADLGVSYVEDPHLVRGLDYYTETTFELESPDLGAQSALAGGGRYDRLAEVLGSEEPVPAIGFAAGMERLFLALDAAEAERPGLPAPDVFIAALGEEAEQWVFRTTQELRAAGLHVALDLKGRSLKAQMREANRQEADYTLIIGGNELEAEEATVKEMESGEQEDVPFAELSTVLLDKCRTEHE
ncbi:histidine--tRNA ligase [Salinibacter sp. 10B]|uniref:histidine--tRNA ligase n=1 Tax=Salinibacter sp. 10B TaxID=1923971 RepID=UPI000CF54747|nr:histidine--tRNA ligase [Salinibacter sp. 10B]PQJ33398.1 histidine--tRNA ligase [Salinibacter sp. 10B]